MGTDIHVYLERRINKGKWQPDKGHSYEEDIHEVFPEKEKKLLTELDCFERNYDLFYKMAGVRGRELGRIKPFTARGLPIDVSEDVAHTIKKQEFHSTSYLSIKEFEKCMKGETKWFEGTRNNDPFNGLHWHDPGVILEYVKREQLDDFLLGTKTEFRIVFGFDS